MEHVRNNLKKEQMLEERYSEIDRENRILLKKMTEIMRQQASETPRETRHPGPQSLNRDARKKELLRITKENQTILKRIQQAQPVYNHIEWEGNHRKNACYLKNCAEYPLVLRSARGAKTSELVALDPNGPNEELQTSRSEKSGMKSATDVGDEGVRYVLKEGIRIGDTYYLVEMSTACDAAPMAFFKASLNSSRCRRPLPSSSKSLNIISSSFSSTFRCNSNS